MMIAAGGMTATARADIGARFEARPISVGLGVAFRILWRSVGAPLQGEPGTRPNEFTNEQNQTLTLKAERLSPYTQRCHASA